MAVWQQNMMRHLQQKEVIVLHGNIRDMAYIKSNGELVPGLSELIRETGRKLGFQQCIFWGVFYDHENKAHNPMWSLERIESLTGDNPPEIRQANSQDRELLILNRWLAEDIRDVRKKTMFVINYIDKLTAYSPRGSYPKDTALLITLIEKIIENITDNNRLLLIALQDTMLPIEYYTNSPRVAVMEIPLPDKEERSAFFGAHLSGTSLPGKHVDLLANISDGLYAKDLDNIARDVLGEISVTEHSLLTTNPADNHQKFELTPSALRKIVNRYRIGTEEDPWARLPLSGPPKGLIDSAENWFQERVIGQDHAVSDVLRAIKKARAAVSGLASGQEAKPKAVFFFAGPTGVGKTYLAKQLTEYLFDSKEAFLRFDMSEFKEEHTVSKLIGAPPGYVGYEKGGMLTNGVKARPFSVILFDEIEKAHPKIMDIFLQILDDGRLTDSRGQTVFFTESVIIFTSNIGTRTTTTSGKGIDEKSKLEAIFTRQTDEKSKTRATRQHFLDAVHDFFMFEISRPEQLNRIGSQIIAFNFLDSNKVQQSIFVGKMREMAKKFQDKFSSLGFRLTFDSQVEHYFMDKYGASIKKFGGRGVVNCLDDEIGYLVAEQKLWAEYNQQTNIIFQVIVDDKGALRCQRTE